MGNALLAEMIILGFGWCEPDRKFLSIPDYALMRGAALIQNAVITTVCDAIGTDAFLAHSRLLI